MDLLVEKDNQSIRLSELGILTVDFDESSPDFSVNALEFSGRNGKLHFGSRHTEKEITYTGYFYADGQREYEVKRNKLYSLFADNKPFYVTPAFDTEKQMYDFERPGQTTAQITSAGFETLSDKRFYVMLDSSIAPELQGNIAGRLLYKLDLSFVTAVLPYGETKPKSGTLSASLVYNGTASASQLETPFYVTVKANASASGINFKLGERTWTYRGVVAVGDEFRLGGVYNTRNGVSINDDTNFEYFILRPGANAVSCSISATVTINNYKELYL